MQQELLVQQVLLVQRALLERLALQVRVQLLSLALQVLVQLLELALKQRLARRAQQQLPQMTCMNLEMQLRKIDQIQGRFEVICGWGFA